MKRYKALINGVVRSVWASDFAGADYYEENWGKPERWVLGTLLNEEQIASALEQRTTQGSLGEDVVEYKLPAEYTVVEEDMTAELAAIALANYSRACLVFGEEVIMWVHSTNDSKDLTLEQMQAIFADPTLAAIERCLWNGSIQSAKVLVQGMQPGLFSQGEKDAVLAKIDAFLTLHGKL